MVQMVKMMRHGEFDRITIKNKKFTYTISINSESVMKFKRTEQRKEEMTL